MNPSGSEDLYPIAILIDELKSDEVQLRLNAIHRISTIALALGPQRARDELVPFIQESLDDEDEVLLALAEELGKNFEDHLGGPQYAHLLLAPLENLAAVEETLVRDKVCFLKVFSPSFTNPYHPCCSQATDSITKIMGVLTPSQTEEYAVPLVRRLSTGDWFTSRISSASLHAPVYKLSSDPSKDEIRRLFTALASDDTPMVRRAAAKHLAVRASRLDLP